MGTIKKILNRISVPRIKYQPLIEVRIFKNALLHNLREYQKQYPKFQFAPVLKSNAYGHGLAQVAEVLDKEDVAFFMVDSFFEALVLRRAGVKSKILILGYERMEQLIKPPLKNCAAGIIDFQTLREVIRKLKKPASFHIKIDTGMHRQGMAVDQVPEIIDLIKTNPNFILEGVCSHFADADGEDQSFTKQQIKKWNEVTALFKQNFRDIKYFHISNTAGAYFAEEIDANVSRFGLGLYGINTSPFSKLDLQPALEMVSVISSIKSIVAGEKVGYGITYEAKAPSIVATVPVGYNEGVDRRLSNKGHFKIGNIFCPLVGRVSMNMSSIDVSQVSNVKIENEVVAISRKSDDKNSVVNMAKICECTAYEILVHVPQHLKRVVK